MATKIYSLRDFPEDLIKKIKVEAAVRGVTATTIVVEALRLRPKKGNRNGKH